MFRDLDIFDRLNQLTKGKKDEYGQIKGSEMTPGAIAEVKRLEEKLREKKISPDKINTSGLTAAEQARMNELFQKGKSKTTLEKVELKELIAKRDDPSTGLDLGKKKILAALYKDLEKLTTVSASSYYVQQLNNWMSKLDTSVLELQFNYKAQQCFRAAPGLVQVC